MRRVIFHIDVNSAFLSWSAVKMVSQGLPDPRLVPSVVSGDPQDRRSIVSAKSIPAKKYGISTGEPVSMALRKCPRLIIVRADFDWYRECSAAFIEICRSYSPVLEQFSIDECFLDMSFRLHRKEPVEVATALKDEIHSRLGFTVNVGVGPNKLSAKMASDFEKPDKVHTLWEGEVAEKLWPLPVRDLLWVGKKTGEKLRAYGIYTVGQLAEAPVKGLAHIVGQKAAASLHDSANGIDHSSVEPERPAPKSYSAERTQPRDVTDPSAIDRILFELACIVCHRIRVDDVRAEGLSIFVKTKYFNKVSKQCRLARPTDVTAVVLNAARELLPVIWDGETPLRQLGMELHDLTKEPAQNLLFGDDKMDWYREWDRRYDLAHAKG